MRKSRRLAGLLLLLGIGLFLLPPSGTVPEVSAADHRDTPSLSMFANSTRDINDVFIFRSPDPAKPNNTVMVFTVNPFTGFDSPTTFDQRQFFDFKIDNNGDAIEDITFRVSFGAPAMNGVQAVTLRGLPAARFPPTGILARGSTGQTIVFPLRGGLTGTLLAADLDDPFFFDALGFQRLLGNMPMNPQGMPIAPLPRLPRTGTAADGDGAHAQNNFGPIPMGTPGFAVGQGPNTLTIVIDVPSSILVAPGGTRADMWGATVLDNVQRDRMGRPAIVTALYRPLGPGAQPNFKDPFNAGLPRNDRRDFRAEMIRNLTTVYGMQAGPAGGLANVLLPDILTFDTAAAVGMGFLNGRRLQDDVIDAELGILTDPDGAGPMMPGITTDNVPNDSAFVNTFPYVAPRNPIAQGRNLQ